MAKTYTQDDLIRILKDKIADMTLTGAAESLGVTAGYLSDIVRGNRNVSEAVAKKMGFERKIVTTAIFREVK